ncbi:MAG: lysozyme inhibitor LprI family protein [Neisseria sp.]|nr:lysozyme inhibitor LprI family protein [Neisseria sp.]
MYRLLWAVLLLPAAALGASFDCTVATHKVERMICQDKALSAMDEELGELFGSLAEASDSPNKLQATQKAWLKTRNACDDAACVQIQYENRIAELACDSSFTGSSLGAGYCAGAQQQVLDRELSALEKKYAQSTAAASNNPDYTAEVIAEEQRSWRNYRSAYCIMQGAIEGGSDGWKNAFAGLCEIEKTQQRIDTLRKDNDITF